MAKEYKLSPERFEKLKEELNYLKTVREKESPFLCQDLSTQKMVSSETAVVSNI